MKRVTIILALILISFFEINAATYYISPSGDDGTGNGSIGSPWFTLNQAWSSVTDGSSDTIYVRGGIYEYNVRQTIISKSGTSDGYICIFAYENETPVINPSASYDDSYGVLVRNCDYLHIKGLDISDYEQTEVNVYDWGLYVADTDSSIFELLKIHNNGVGVTMSRWDTGEKVTGNLFLNCDFYENYDPLSTDAYGGADGLSIRVDNPDSYNTVRGCRIYNNADDGFDGWQTAGFIFFEDCWFFGNGYREDGTTAGGDGNGLKLGPTNATPESGSGHEKTQKRTVQNCISFNNRTGGIIQNNSRAEMTFYNNTVYNNGGVGFSLYQGDTIVFTLKNNILYGNVDPSYITQVSSLETNSFVLDDRAVAGMCVDNPSFSITNADFVSVDTTGVSGARKADGSLPDINFLKLASSSDLIDAGTDVGIDYNGTAPDLGAFEFVTNTPASGSTTIQTNGSGTFYKLTNGKWWGGN